MENRQGRALFRSYIEGHHGFFCGLGKRTAAAGGLPYIRRGAAPLLNSSQVLERFLAHGIPGPVFTYLDLFSLNLLQNYDY